MSFITFFYMSLLMVSFKCALLLQEAYNAPESINQRRKWSARPTTQTMRQWERMRKQSSVCICHRGCLLSSLAFWCHLMEISATPAIHNNIYYFSWTNVGNFGGAQRHDNEVRELDFPTVFHHKHTLIHLKFSVHCGDWKQANVIHLSSSIMFCKVNKRKGSERKR